MIHSEKVKVICHVCNSKSTTDITYGEDERYPDDFNLSCPACDNWESGSLPTQSFEVL